MRNPLSPSPLQVWAIEDTSVQLTWGSLAPGPITASAGDALTTVDHPGGAGTIDLVDLSPDTDHRIEVSHGEGRTSLSARTLPSPPGRALCRIATISDLHLGSRHWGASKLMVDRSGHPESFALRCAGAAVAEAVAWGAELLIVKGDAAHHQDAAHFALVGDLLDRFDDLAVLLIPGNHDVDGETDTPVPAKVGKRGVPYVRGVASEDLNGIRVIVADTTVPGRGSGSLDRVGNDVTELATLTDQPCFVGLHHQLQPYRYPTHYPIGVSAPSSTDFLTELARANRRAVVTSGHTHRNRVRRDSSSLVTEVASTRDWPGVWAGYAVHEGGIRQVVRRVAAPNAISWTEYSRRALLGLWEPWAAGSISHRCVTHRWS